MSGGAALDELSDTGGEGRRTHPKSGYSRGWEGQRPWGALLGLPQPCRVPRRSSKCLDVPAVGEDTDGPQGWECQKEIQGFPSSPLEPRIPSAPSPISLSQQGKLEEVKGRLFQRTEVIKIKSLSAAERSLQKAGKRFLPAALFCSSAHRPRPAGARSFSPGTMGTALGEGRQSRTPG